MPRNFTILLMILIIFKVLILLFPADSVFTDSSETFRGVLAKETISHNRTMPVFEYQYNPYYGGTIIISFLAVPFFLLFGPSLFSLKLTTLVFAVLTFFLLYKIAEKYISKTSAVIASLLFIFGPQYFLQRSSIACGDYCESSFFSLLGVYIFLSIFKRFPLSRGIQSLSDAAIYGVFGLISGFSIWLNYMYIITLLSCFAIWFCLDRKMFLRKDFIVFLLGFFLGFSPWIYYNFTHNFQGCIAGRDNIVSHFFRKDFLFSLTRFKDVVVTHIPNSLMIKNGQVPDRVAFVLSRIYYLFFLVSYIGLWFSFKKEIRRVVARSFDGLRKPAVQIRSIVKAFLLLYPLIFCFFYSFYNIPTAITGVGYHDYRRMMPLFVFMFLIIAQFMSYCVPIRGKRCLIGAASFMVFISLYGFLGNLSLLSRDNFAKSFNMKGYSYNLLGINIAESSKLDIIRWFKIIKTSPRDYWPEVCLGFGEGVGQDIGDDIELNVLDKYLRMADGLECGYLKKLYAGLGRGTVSAMRENDINYMDVLKLVDKKYHNDFKRGMRQD